MTREQLNKALELACQSATHRLEHLPKGYSERSLIKVTLETFVDDLKKELEDLETMGYHETTK